MKRRAVMNRLSSTWPGDLRQRLLKIDRRAVRDRELKLFNVGIGRNQPGIDVQLGNFYDNRG
ncbi:hypothetical protein MJ561_01735 [Klebsiella pneumoniae]|nr:hypothetical protein MJ561_01735 [Klebsiella pneumoniae]